MAVGFYTVYHQAASGKDYLDEHDLNDDSNLDSLKKVDLEKFKLEELQDNEYDSVHGNADYFALQNRKLAGLIELQYGEPNFMNHDRYCLVPSRKDIIIFPSWLRHTVYAHYEENAVRISVAGNVSIMQPEPA